MRRAKEDAMATKEVILEAALRCFAENGFDASSLEAIARDAAVTRGAVYWHFKDKKELYRAVVRDALEKADVVAYAHNLPDGLSYEERLYDVFWYAQSENSKVDFVYTAMNDAAAKNEFKDLYEAIQLEKVKLYRYFVEETRIHIKLNQIQSLDAEIYASDLFLLFEGMFFTKQMAVGMSRKRTDIEQYVRLIIKDLI